MCSRQQFKWTRYSFPKITRKLNSIRPCLIISPSPLRGFTTPIIIPSFLLDRMNDTSFPFNCLRKKITVSIRAQSTFWTAERKNMKSLCGKNLKKEKKQALCPMFVFIPSKLSLDVEATGLSAFQEV